MNVGAVAQSGVTESYEELVFLQKDTGINVE